MTNNLWRTVGSVSPIHLAGSLLRMVESQEQVATNHLVSSLEAQALLESMLEATKPNLSRAPEGLHYLLATPFRYPPLPHGSRFGVRHEPSLLYGSLSKETTLCETAYYRLVFWQGMVEPPSGPYNTEHTLFAARYETAQGLQLQKPPFSDHRQTLTDPMDYSATHTLGTAMREAGIEAFEFTSARDPNHGINVALFTPKALAVNKPDWSEGWLCKTDGAGVSFYSLENKTTSRFDIDVFYVDGVLPQPAI